MLLTEYIGIEQTKELSRQLSSQIFGNLIVGVSTFFILWGHFSKVITSFWLLVVMILVLLRWWSTKSYSPDSTNRSNYKTRLKWFTFWYVANGLCWGFLVLLFHDPNAPTYSAYLGCVLAGYIAVGASVTSFFLPACFAFMLALSIPVLLSAIFNESLFLKLLAISAPFYLVVMVSFARTTNRNFKAAKKLEFDTASLLNEITAQKKIAETAIIEKNHFLAATSHDLRQPLHAMNLYVDALRPRLADPMDSTILESIALSGRALSDLLHGLLDISRLDASVIEDRPQHIALANLVNHLEEEFSPQAAEGNLQLIIDSDEQHIVYADPVLLERVIRNLLSNAIKYTGAGQVKLTSSKIGSNIAVTISDTGIGIADNKMTEIFSEFTQVDNPERDRSKGLGLGLAIVKRLCDFQNIELLFESQLDQGTQVRLMVKGGDSALLPIAFSSVHKSFEHLTILCVDDEEAIRDGMQMIISSWKCHPIIASDGASALDAVRNLDTPLDMIISDLRLCNEESGVDVIQSIREELNEQIPAIVITGDTAVDRIELVSAADVVVMHKPIKTADLRGAIELLLENHAD